MTTKPWRILWAAFAGQDGDKTCICEHIHTEVCDARPVHWPTCCYLPSCRESAPWPVQNYTAWWHRNVHMNNLPEVVTQKWNSHELNWSQLEWQVQCPNHHTTRPHRTGYAVKSEKKYLMERTQPSRGWASQTVNGRNISRLSVGTISLSSTHTCCMHITYTQLHVSYTKWCHNGVAYGEDLQCMGRNNMERSKESCQWSPYLLMMQ